MFISGKHLILGCAISLASLSAWGDSASGGQVGETATAAGSPTCSLDALRELPDVRIKSMTSETAPAPHCKVAGVIGTETNFELLLPDDWNGKFVMGGGGGFVGSVVNTALGYGVLEKGFATVGRVSSESIAY
mgnify:FL=1